MIIVGKEYNGVVLEAAGWNIESMYKVHLPILSQILGESEGIWVKNHIHKTNWQYFPIQPQTDVVVKFFRPDINSGYIDRILFDNVIKHGGLGDVGIIGNIDTSGSTGGDEKEKNSIPFNSQGDRDNTYQLLRTPIQNHILIFNEETVGDPLPPNSIHLYYFKDRSRLVLDETGWNFNTQDSWNQKIALDKIIDIGDNKFEKVTNSIQLKSGGESRESTHFGKHIRVLEGSIFMEANDDSIHLLAHSDNGTINMVSNYAVSLSAYSDNAQFVIESGNILRIASKCETSIVCKRDVIIGSGCHTVVGGKKTLVLASDKKTIIKSPKTIVEGNMNIKGTLVAGNVNGIVVGEITGTANVTVDGVVQAAPISGNFTGKISDKNSAPIEESEYVGGLISEYYQKVEPEIFDNIEDDLIGDLQLTDFMIVPIEDEEDDPKPCECKDEYPKFDITPISPNQNAEQISEYSCEFVRDIIFKKIKVPNIIESNNDSGESVSEKEQLQEQQNQNNIFDYKIEDQPDDSDEESNGEKTYNAQYIYNETDFQQLQNKQAKKLTQITALVAEEAFVPEPDYLKFEN